MDSDVKLSQVGNLSNKTIVELKELLTRQETILKNVKIIKNLPDKGEKIKAFRDSLIRHIQEKSPITKVKGYTDKESTYDESCLKNLKPKFSNNTTKFKSKTETSKETDLIGQLSPKPVNERDIVHMDHSDLHNHGTDIKQTNEVQKNVRTEASDIQLDKNIVSSELKHVKADNGSENQFSALRDKQLIECVEAREIEDFNNMRMSNATRDCDTQRGETVLLSKVKEGVGTSSNSRDSKDQQEHTVTPVVHADTEILNRPTQQQTSSVDDIQDKLMDISLQDSESRNSESDQQLKQKILSISTEVQPHFKPNSFLKISRIQDLPDKYKFKSRNKQPIDMDTEMTHKSEGTSTPSKRTAELEESAATPPTYKYKETKLISVTDSVVLLQQQQAKQEKLQAELAAVRLAQRLNIKMDTYNPEGTDMSYREKEEEEIDSDDECEMTGYNDDET